MNFTARLILAQSTIGAIKRDRTNPRFGSSYASLDAIIEAVRPALAAQELVLTQHVEDGHVSTRISGSEPGEQLYSSVPICAPLDDPQRYGAALTYARRYGISTLLCLATDDDDDGNSAQPPKPSSSSTSTPTRSSTAGAIEKASTVIEEHAPVIDRLRSIEVHFGKNKGTALGQLTEFQLKWYATEWEPRFDEKSGRLSDTDEKLKLAAKQLYVGIKNPAALADPTAAATIIPGGYVPAEVAPAVLADEADGIPF